MDDSEFKYKGYLFLWFPVGTLVKFRYRERYKLPNDPSFIIAFICEVPCKENEHIVMYLNNGKMDYDYYTDVDMYEISEFVTPDGTTDKTYYDEGVNLIDEYSDSISY